MSGNVTTTAFAIAEDIPSADAARALEVTVGTLEQWSRQFSFPADVGAAPLSRFRRAEIDALCATLPSAHSVEGAIREAQRKLGV